jgi:branched-subunit amino acid ABC-type transport system permease component
VHILLQGVVQGVVYGGVYAVAALGFSLIYSVTGVFHIAYGAILTMGVYTLFAVGGGDAIGELLLGLAAGVALASLITMLVYLTIYGPLQKRGASTLELFVISLGLNLAIGALVIIIFGPDTKSFSLPSFTQLHEVLGLRISDLGFVCIAAGLAALAGIHFAARRTLFGQQVLAVSANPELARLRGVRVKMVVGSVFAVAGALSVVSGVLLGMNSSVTVESGTSLTLLASIATLLGGKGSYVGAYTGGLIVGLVSALANALIPGQWSTAAVFGTFVLIVLVRPQGLAASGLAT